jgi:hypothetical protein
MKVNGHLHTPAALSPNKEILMPVVRRVGGPQGGCVHYACLPGALDVPLLSYRGFVRNTV